MAEYKNYQVDLNNDNIIGGTKVLSPLTPPNLLDEYPTHLEEFGQGGYRTVEDSNLSLINKRYRKDGMIINIKNESLQYLNDKEFPDESRDFPFVYPEQGLDFYTNFEYNQGFRFKLETETIGGNEYTFIKLSNFIEGDQEIFKIREDGVVRLRNITNEMPGDLSIGDMFMYNNKTYITQ